MKAFPLFWKLFLLFALAMAALMLTGMISASQLVQQHFIDRNKKQYMAELQSLGHRVLRSADLRNPSSLEPHLPGLPRNHTVGLRVMNLRGDVLVTYPSSSGTLQDSIDHTVLKEVRTSGAQTLERTTASGQTELTFVIPLRPGGSLEGFLQARLPLATFSPGIISWWNGPPVLYAGLFFFLVLLAGFYLIRRWLGPLEGFYERLQRMREQDPSQDISRSLAHGSGGAAGKLERTVQELLQKWQERWQRVTSERDNFRQILDGLQEAVISVNEREQVTYCNAKALEFFGLGENRYQLPIWETVRIQPLTDAVSECLEESQEVHREFSLIEQNEEKRFESYVSPLVHGQNEEPAGAVLTVRNVTELRRLQTVRQDFVANVSHELKTPLTALQGLVETLLDPGGMDPDTRQRFLEKIQNQIERMTHLVEDLLTISRLEAHEDVLETESIDLQEPVRNSVRLLRASAQDKRHELQIDLPDEAINIQGNREALQHLTNNLLDNAIKYTPERGTIGVSVRREQQTAVLEVRDSGVGIEPTEQNRIFERFYRVDKARSRDMGGTGLGLSIVKHIALSLDGEISLKSTPGKGSTFRVTFPLASKVGRPE